MLGVRFLDVDFMRENLACASPTVYVTRVFCTVVKSGCMERIAIAMQDGGTGAGAQHGGAGREANLIFVLRPNLYNRTPGRGGFMVASRCPAWSASRSQCRMEAPGRVREPRANLILSCRRTSIMNPPVGGTFWFQIFIQASSPEIWCELFLVREVAGAEWGGLFLGYLLSEKTPAALVRLMQPP